MFANDGIHSRRSIRKRCNTWGSESTSTRSTSSTALWYSGSSSCRSSMSPRLVRYSHTQMLPLIMMAQAGYKMRTHLSKSLQVRCKTIKKAIARYNTAANALNPPRPTLDWSQVSHYGFLEEFNLLQDSRNDVREKRWSKPAVRETMKLYRRIQRAREEIIRLNVEIRRVHTAIRDEAILFKTVLAAMQPTNPLRGALLDFATRRQNINQHILCRLKMIYALPDFSGIPTPGTRIGATPLPMLDPIDTVVPDDDDEKDDASDDEPDDEEAGEEVSNVVTFISELAVH